MSARRRQRGFTLAELLIVCAVLAFIMAGLLSLQQQGQQAYMWGASRVEVQQNARIALEMMVSEIRSALAVTSSAGCNASCTSIGFNDQNGTAVTYSLAGTNLQRNGATVIGGVQTLTIQTFDSTGTATATPANVRAVNITLSTRTEKVSGTPGGAVNQHATVASRVRLRNL
jgi:prepilin-type N-terminal cleavage/methylation domain-containing protein